ERVVINFLSRSQAKGKNIPILHTPPYELAYKELTLQTPLQAAEARKVKVFCEDEIAVHFAKKLIKKRNILRTVEFHSSLAPASTTPGTPYSALVSLCVQFPLLLEGSLVLFDADVPDEAVDKIKDKSLFLYLPDECGLALERRMVAYIIELENHDNFFTKFDKERDMFLDEFKQAGIRSLTENHIKDATRTPIKNLKNWVETNKSGFKQYVSYYCDNLPQRSEFVDNFVDKINSINAAAGIPMIGAEGH
ncbi:MAG: hypothetical protein J0653_01680, partial [Deltaproteobacteria bacterium]|nr:hypothetical protein [Deltaproteobacteria bacterium]